MEAGDATHVPRAPRARGAGPSLTPGPGCTALEFVGQHVREGSTGELVAVDDGLEVHVYLQAGRVAWGTTTAERFVFRRHLEAQHGLTEEALRSVIDEAYRAGAPLGESLVNRGVLTVDQVRGALRAQVLAVLRSLARCATAAALFLPRGERYLAYDARLTFEFEELMEEC